MEFEELPLEIWLELAGYLNITDLLHLRVTNRRIKRNITQPYLWKKLCNNHWIDQLRVEEEIYRVPTKSCRNYRDIDDWCKYGRRCYHSDNHILHRIEKLTKTYSSSTYWNKFDIILKNNYDAMIPILTKIITQEYDIHSPHNFSFDVRTCAQQLLDYLRHEKYFENVWYQSFFNTTNCGQTESVFMDFSMLDPSFDRLAPHILRVRNTVDSLLLAKYNNRLESLYSIRPALRVEIIAKELYKVLKVGSVDKITTDRKYYNEDYFLSRIYAGEALGHPLLILVIIQSICRRYKVETSLTEYYLAIIDNNLQSGGTLLGVDPNTLTRQYFTNRSFVKMLCRETQLDEQTVIDSIVPNLLKPLTVETCRYNLFCDISVECKGSISDACNQEGVSSGDVHSMNIRYEHIMKYFPHSKQQIPNKIMKYIESIDERVLQLDGHNEENSIKLDVRSLKRDKEYKELLKIVKNTYPSDCVHIFSPGLINESYTYLDWLMDSRSISIDPNELSQENNFGTFSTYRATELVCVLTPLYKLTDLQYVTIMDCVGDVKIVSSNLVGDILQDNSQIEKFLQIIMPHNELGYLFESVDWTTGRLLINDRIRSSFQSRSISPGGAIVFEADHVPV